jgi:transglutaminase-like putative cysteine protease
VRSSGIVALAGVLLGCSSPTAGARGEREPIAEPPPAASSGAAAAKAPRALRPARSELSMSSIPIEMSERVDARQMWIEAPRYRADVFGELTNRGLLAGRRADGVLTLSLPETYVGPRDPVAPFERECSFVMDCDEPSVQELLGQVNSASAAPSAEEIVRFVAHYIDKKHGGRSFDIASVVARRREGDCTEHAVLLTSLLRLAKLPSHLVIGVLILAENGRLQAFGHAWVEYHDGAAWRLADASNPPDVVARARYLPIQVMSVEGANHSRAQLDGFHVAHIEGLVVSTAFVNGSGSR